MKYALLYFEAPGEIAKRSSPEDAPAYWAAWTQYMETFAGARQGGSALEPPAMATVVSKPGDEAVVEDGPYADSHEELGGFVIVEAENLDDAIAMAAGAPCAATGRVEIRPVYAASADSAAA